MLAYGKTALFGDPVLTFLDGGIEEFLHVPALHADEVIVVAAFVELEDRLAGFKVVTFENARLLELGEHAINGGQPDIHVFGDQQAIDVFGGEVTVLGLLEQIEDLQPRKGCLQADTFEILGVAWTWRPRKTRDGGRESGRPPYDIVSAPRLRMRPPRRACVRSEPPCANSSLPPCCSPRWVRPSLVAPRPRSPDFVKPYRIDIRQGNYVTQEMVSQLKPGMSRDQVRFVLGTPLVTDVFHTDRWDYIYRFRPGKGDQQAGAPAHGDLRRRQPRPP